MEQLHAVRLCGCNQIARVIIRQRLLHQLHLVQSVSSFIVAVAIPLVVLINLLTC
jgi:hypothetical protein